MAAVQLSNHRRAVAKNIYFFYPVGNTAPQYFAAKCPPEVPCRVLLLGCGDIRSILYTNFCELKAEGEGRVIDWTCCDIEPAIIARNALFMSLLVSEEATSVIPQLWRLYYNHFLNGEDITAVRVAAERLLDIGDSVEQWHASPLGRHVRMVNRDTLQRVRALLKQYADRCLPDRIGTVVAKLRSKEAKRIEGMCVLTSVLRSSPYVVRASANSDAHNTVNKTYNKTGIFEAKAPNSTSQLKPNPLFAVTETCRTHWCVHYANDPQTGFFPSIAYADRPGDERRGDKITPKDIVLGCKTQFTAWCQAFTQQFSEGLVTVRFFAGDVFEFCDALVGTRCALERGEELPKFALPRNRLTPISLDGGDYEGGAPMVFDCIDTSNLSDQQGMLGLLLATAPLLAVKPHAILRTDTLAMGLNSVDEDHCRQVYHSVNLSDNASAGVLVGLAVHEHMTQTVTSPPSFEGSKEQLGSHTQRRMLISWKHSWACDDFAVAALSDSEGKIVKPAVVVSNHDLSRSIGRVVKVNLADSFSVSDLNTQNIAAKGASMMRNQCDAMRGTPETAVRFAFQCLTQVKPSSPRSIGDDLYSAVTMTDTSLLSSNRMQERALLLHVLGLYTSEALEGAPSSIASSVLDNRNTSFIDKVRSPVVRVGLVVPREKALKLYDSPDSYPTPPLTLHVRSGQIDNHFSSIHTCWVRVVRDGGEECSDEDGYNPVIEWDNFSIQQSRMEDPKAVLAVSALVPTFTLGLEPPEDLLIDLKVATYMAGFDATLKRFGFEQSVFASPLSDHNRVSLVTKGVHAYREQEMYRSPLAGLRNLSSPTRSPLLVGGKGLTASPVQAYFAEDGSLNGFDCTLTYTGSSHDVLLSGGTIDVIQISICVIAVVVGDKEKVEAMLVFPYPVDVNQSKTSVSRIQGWVVVKIQPVRDTPLRKQRTFPVFSIVRSKAGPPVVWGMDRVVLRSCLELDNIQSGDWMHPTGGAMMGQAARLEIQLDRKSPHTTFCESLYSLFEGFCGNQLHGNPWTPLFTLYLPDSRGGFAFIYCNALRLDSDKGSFVVDACVCVLDYETAGFIPPALLNQVPTARIMVESEGEATLWMHYLPVAIERARTAWKHTATCEYITAKKLPLSTEAASIPYCSCGAGRDLPPKFADSFPTVSRHFHRAAISPLYSNANINSLLKGVKGDQWIEEKAQSGGAQRCVCGSIKDLRSCSRCGRVSYCGIDCQRDDWKTHKKVCRKKE